MNEYASSEKKNVKDRDSSKRAKGLITLFLFWYCQRNVKEIILRLQYLYSLFGYLSYFPGALPVRRYRFKIMKKLEHLLNEWRGRLEKNEEFIKYYSKSQTQGFPSPAYDCREDIDCVLRHFATHMWHLHETIKVLRQAHLFLDRRIDSLALIPLIPRRFARMSAIKNSALWREIVRALIRILLPEESAPVVGVTWEHTRSARTLVIEDDVVNLTLPAWNLFWFAQSMSLYHEVPEALLVAVKPPDKRKDFFSSILKINALIKEALTPLLLAVGNPARSYRTSIANELTADLMGMVLGGPYYFLYSLYEILSNPRMASSMAEQSFTYLGKTSNVDKALFLHHDHLDFHRFKEVLRVFFITEVMGETEVISNNKPISDKPAIFLEIGNIVRNLFRKQFREPPGVPQIMDTIEATSKSLVQTVRQAVSKTSHAKFLTFYEGSFIDLVGVMFNLDKCDRRIRTIKKPQEFCKEWMFTTGFEKKNGNSRDREERLYRCGEINERKIVYSSVLVNLIKGMVEKHLDESYRKDHRVKSVVAPVKAIIPVLSLGLIVERISEFVLNAGEEKRRDGGEQDLNAYISRKVHALSDALDFLDYSILTILKGGS